MAYQWLTKGLNLRSDYKRVKQVLGVSSLVDYYFFLKEYKPLVDLLELKWDDKIIYRCALTPSKTEARVYNLTEDKHPAATNDFDNQFGLDFPYCIPCSQSRESNRAHDHDFR